jgi:uncharacterized protein (TIGR03546 family)
MFFFRKIGKFLRGKATPFQIISATLLGSLLGSLPGLGQGPLLLLLLLFLLIVLNANLFLAGLFLIGVKLLTLVLMPVSFQLGAFLLEGPLNAPVSVLANAPVTAWFGLDHYVMLPSLLTGLLVGLLGGVAISRSLKRFRRKMARLETGSERYQAYASRFWVRSLAWIFVGGLKGKQSWEELSERKGGLPVRPLGIVFVLALGVLGYAGIQFLDTTIVTSYVRDTLERVNGATVDIQAVEMDPAANRVTISGLAMADPEALQENRFEAREIVADISGMSILAKKVVIDSLSVIEPATGTNRRVAGQLTLPREEPEEPEEPEASDDRSIEEYLGQASVWRERLSMAKRVYDRIAPHLAKDGEEDPAEAEETGPAAPGWRERLAQRAREAGYAHVRAESLVRGSPRLLIRSLDADTFEVGGNDTLYTVNAGNLSTQPRLVDEPGRIEVRRPDGSLEVVMELPSAETPAVSRLNVSLKGLAVSELESMAGRELPLEGGQMAIEGRGTIDGGLLSLPLTVTFEDSILKAFGSNLPMDGVPLQLEVYGPLDNPRLAIPTDALEQAVKEGGRKKIEGLIEDKAGEELKKLLPFGGG